MKQLNLNPFDFRAVSSPKFLPLPQISVHSRFGSLMVGALPAADGLTSG
jgi:hypothetical protein